MLYSFALENDRSVPSITMEGQFCSCNYIAPTSSFNWWLMLLLLQFSTHDVVVLKPNKADLGSPSLGQGVVYRLKVSFTSYIGSSFFCDWFDMGDSPFHCWYC